MRSLWIAAWLALIPAVAPAAPQAVRLVASEPSRVRFTVAVPEARVEPVDAASGLELIRIEGYGNDAPPGTPSLPVRIVHVAVPANGAVSVRAFAAGGETREGVVLAPPPWVERGREQEPPRYERSAAAYRATAPLAPERAQLAGISWMRNQRVASIAIQPADYEPAARRVTLFREIQVEVEVEGGELPGPPFEPVDPFESVYREVLVNYEQGRAWRRPAREPGTLLGAALPPGIAAHVTPTVPETSVFVGRNWVKIAITKTGFYKLDFGQVRNLALFSSLPNGADSAPLDSLRLFTWPGFPVLPEESYCDTCDFREVAIQFQEDGDRIFNRNADAFYFFALGPSDWADLYEPSKPDTVFINHPYETKNYYYLTVATAAQPVARGTPARIPTRSGQVTVDGTELRPADFEARVHYEQDTEYFPDLSPFYFGVPTDVFWEKWFWRSMSVGNVFAPSLDALGVDSTQVASLRVRQWGIDGYDPICYLNPSHLLEVSVNGTALGQQGWDGRRAFSYLASIPAGALRTRNTISVALPTVAGCTQRFDRSALGWIELRYRRRFVPVSQELNFDSPTSGGNYIYDIGPFTAATPPRVFDVTDAYAPVEIVSFDWSDPAGPSHQLSFETVESGRRRYRIVRDSSIVRPDNANVYGAPLTSLKNLRSRTRGADYLLIYADGFQAAADSLARWRRSRLPVDGASAPFEVDSIPMSALYDQFSGGRTDPSVIRNFLRAAYYNWRRRPAFVTLLGDGSYDFKNIRGLALPGQPGALVPSYENGFAIGKQFATDDWLLNVDTAAVIIPDFYGGRIPAGDPQAALDFVLKKVLFYERQAPLGAYRNKVMLIADDNEQGSNDDPLHWRHLQQTSELDSSFTPPHVDRSFVYLHTYPDGPGDTKPGAKADIKQIVNDGVLMFNYIGHGSPFKIADETVLSDVDAGTFVNATRPTLFVAASCDVGKFSDPTVQSLGERLVLAPAGGAIAVISATEIAYSDLNVSLNRQLYAQLFDRAPATGQFHESIAQALLIAKNLTSFNNQFNITNNSKYQVMGDAATRLNLPRLWIDLSLHPCDTCTAVLPEAQRGTTVTFRGRVLDRPGGSPVPFDGLADLLIEDSAPRDLAPDCPLFPGCNNPPIQYWYKAGPMFRGDVVVRGGTLQGQFVVPVEARGGARGRVRAYVQGRGAGEGFDSDGVGTLRTQVSPGPPVTGDDEGPTITLSFASGSTTVKPDALLRVDLHDPSGILITGHTLQNGIVVTLDGNTTARVDITPSFRYATGSHTTGTASWRLPNLSPGPHSIRVSAADNLAAGLAASTHRSSASIAIQVVETPPLKIARTYLFPNPTVADGGPRSGGQFVVDAVGDSVNALLRVYTVSGRLIRTLKSFGRQGQIQIPWDGLDDEGFALGNGTYLYRVQLNVRNSRGESSPLQHAVAEGRFVVLNR